MCLIVYCRVCGDQITDPDLRRRICNKPGCQKDMRSKPRVVKERECIICGKTIDPVTGRTKYCCQDCYKVGQVPIKKEYRKRRLSKKKQH